MFALAGGAWMRDVVGFEEIDRSQTALVGGKGAHLGELARIEGIRVPPGFCVTTEVFRRVVEGHDTPAEIRRALETAPLPAELVAEIGRRVGEHAWAVRSSATAEDSPTASFAGQHDTYLDVVGPAAIVEHIRRCWASLFSDRAISYRERNGLDHRQVHMAVVVQRMVAPVASGILFTADPVTGNRKVATVEAIFGLGEALVSGRVNADSYRVRDAEVVHRTIAGHPTLTDAQAVQLARLGRRIEAHFGAPQDIEWCLVAAGFAIVQSRPITTLFPIPAAEDDAPHVYLSVGHQQMMTDAMKPLGLSVWQLTAGRPMVHAGGRLFVDVSRMLASPASRAALVDGFTRSDPLTGDALRTIAERGFVPAIPDEPPTARPGGPPAPIETDPAIVAALIAQSQASIAAAKREIATRSGVALLDFILADIPEMKRILTDPTSSRAILVGMEAAWWLNDKLHAWLGETNVADTLTLSVPDNVTSEMGLALLGVADTLRRDPAAVAVLEAGADFPGALPAEARRAVQAWLDRYGMRGVGEIDITRPRWSERPALLVPLILGHVRNFAPGEAERRFEEGKRLAAQKEADVLARLRALPDGEQKAAEAKQRIDRVRTFAGFREYPKYAMISRYLLYKQALVREAGRLVEAGVLREPEDIFFLTFQELHEVVRSQRVDEALLAQRKAAFHAFQALPPPRVLTSEGEVITGAYRRRDLPEGALVGLAVSSGTVAGRARVVLELAHADLEPGDILVTRFTDPSWTPLFVGIAGLVTEIGGQMTHGAVIAREYGLPAVVGVEGATVRIRDGQRIRVHGTEGYVEILDHHGS
jgi:pyruvate,water dikinase